MFFDLYGLYQDIIKYDRLYIYGMGIYSEIVVSKLLYDLGLRTKTAGYVLSDDQPQNQSSKDGIPIYKINNLHIDTSASIFLIAARPNYASWIEENLKSCNYDNYIFLSHYERNDNNIYFRFEKSNFNQFCEYIAEWYEYKYSERIVGDYLENHQKICSEVKEIFTRKIKNPDIRNDKQIVFVVAALYPRINKIIGALVDRGYEMVVLNIDRLSYPYSKYEEKNIRVVHCECIEELLFEAAKFNPLLFYVRPEYRNSTIANIMLMQRDSYGKIVIDIHDIAKCQNLPPEQQWLYDIEKDALESADGVVWRYDAENFLKEKYGYQYTGKSIQFWDYCYDEFIFNEFESDDALRLCCIDSEAECLNPFNYDDLRKEGIARYANICDILDKIGNRRDCELILYVSRVSDKDLKELKRLEEEYTNFNYFVGFLPMEIIQRISKCDYGCCFYHPGRIPTDKECIEKSYRYFSDTYEVSSSNKYFDFLNAGIPIVTSSYDGKKQIDYLRNYNVIVDMDLKNLDIEYLKEKKYLYRKNVKVASKHLAISAQIDRLIDFFNSV